MSAQGRVIPCIDVMDGKVVQLVRGKEKALELESPDIALKMFEAFSLLHIIDLDAALGQGENTELIREILSKKAARVGGGIRTPERAAEWVSLGAEQVIVGSAAYGSSGVDTDFLRRVGDAVGPERVILAIDSFQGSVTVGGWRKSLSITPAEAIDAATPYCAGFLCTFVDNEGTLGGTHLELFESLRKRTERTLIAAGGIATMQEVESLISGGVEVALGMAIYTGTLSLEELAKLRA